MKRDLANLKARLVKKASQSRLSPLVERFVNQAWTNEERRACPPDINGDQATRGWVVDYRMTKHLKDVIRTLYQDSLESEDAREFIMGVQEHFKEEIESWGETPMSAQEYMAAQEAEQERAAKMKEFLRLKKELGV